MKNTLFLLAVLLMGINTYAQQIRNCGTTSYMSHIHTKDTTLKLRMKANEEFVQNWIKNYSNESQKAVIRIPVVFHILYKFGIHNVSDAQIQSQLDILNEDYRRYNSDTSDTPALFKSVAADTEIEFCLAHVSPTGGWTDGVTRTNTTKSVFDLSQNDAKFTSQGGQDAWNRDDYLNVWVVPAIKDGAETGILGYAQFPGGNASTDGVVIGYNYFGNIGTATSPFNKGRTTTHEVGHWLGLYHIWGDDNGSCSGTDKVDDTPNQADYNFGCPNFPHPSCSNTSDMFMNYMDYTDDACMNIFTEGQKLRMLGYLNGARASIKSSTKCSVLSISEKSMIKDVKVYPNPSTGGFSLNTEQLNLNSNYTIRVFDLLGQLVYHKEYTKEIKHLSINLPEASNGIYMLYIDSDSFNFVKKIQILK